MGGPENAPSWRERPRLVGSTSEHPAGIVKRFAAEAGEGQKFGEEVKEKTLRHFCRSPAIETSSTWRAMRG